MTEITVDSKKVEKVAAEKVDIVVRAADLRIENKGDLEIAAALMQGGNGLLKEIDGIFKEPNDAAYKAHRSIKGAWNNLRNPVADAIGVIKDKVAGYHRQIEADAEKARKLEAARLAKLEEERRINAAVAAEERGQSERADAIIEKEPEPIKPLITTPPPPKVKGITTQDKFSGKIVDLPAFIQWTLDTLSFTEYFELKQGVLDKAIQRKKGDVTIPGVEIVKDIQVGSRSV